MSDEYKNVELIVPKPKRYYHLLLVLALLLLSPIVFFDSHDPHGSLGILGILIYTTPIAVVVLVHWYRLDRRRRSR